MADIRIKDLPLATGGTAPVGTDAVAIDGLTTRRTTITALGNVAVPIASQAEAEAGTDPTKRMVPLTVKQSIASEVGVTLASASALQPSDIGSNVQAYDTNLDTLSSISLGAAGTSILSFPLSGDVRSFLDAAPYVNSRASLKALDTTKDTTAIMVEEGIEGVFNWRPGNYSTHITADTAEGIFIKANAIASSAGAWVRVYDELDVRWFGAVGDGSDATAAFSAAIALSSFLGRNKIICRDPTKQFKIIELQITANLEIDLYGGTILGDFGAWGTHSTLGTPIYWTKNVFYSVAANAPSITLKNMTLNGQSDHAFAMTGGTPIIDFRGAAAAGRCIIRFENFTFTRGSNRIYTAGSGITAPTLALDYRNMEILVYNADEVWVDKCQLRSSPGEMLQIQSDDARTIFRINDLYGTKARDTSPSSKWSSSALNVLNCHPSSEMRNSRFYFFTKGPVNWQMDGGVIDSCVFDWVDDSNGLDFNEAGSYRFNDSTVRNCSFKNIVGGGIRTSGSCVTLDNNSFENVNICHLIEAGIAGNPARGSWLRTTPVALSNITIKNPRYVAYDAAHIDKVGVKVRGVSATIPAQVFIDGGSVVDRQPAGRKANFNVYGENAWLSLQGYFGDGTTALVYMTGVTGKIKARDCIFSPEPGEGVHTFELNAVTMGKKSLMVENCARIVALDAGQVDFRNTGSTIDIDAIHVDGSPDFAGTTNNAIIARDGNIAGSVTYDPPSIAAGSSASTTVTVTGARLAVNDTVKISPSISPGALIVSGAITASNTVTVTYFNPTAGAIDMASHTLTAYVTKGSS